MMVVEIKEPVVTNLVNGLYFKWTDQGISATVTRIKNLSDGRKLCQLEIETTLPTYPPRLYYGEYSLLSLSHRQALERMLEKRCDKTDWFEILQQISSRTVTTMQRGEPVIEINSGDEISPAQHFIYPFLPLNHPTVFYGDGGAGKSYLAAMLAVAARIPWVNNPLGMTVPLEPAEVVYLDYEACLDDFQRRITKVCKGNDLPDCTIRYRRCYEPLADEIDELKDQVHADLVVIDSIGAACAGDLHGSEVPTRFYNAVRKLNATVLCTYHQNKEREMYGNRFFWNLGRSVFEVRKVQNTNEPVINIGLLHQKYNEGPLQQPIALNVEFTDDGVIFAQQDIANIPELLTNETKERRITHKDQLKFALLAGSMTVAELNDETGILESSIRTAFTRYPDTFEKEGDRWKLKENTI